MSNSVLFTGNVVFEDINHLNMFCGVDVKLPDNIPYDCNLVCYKVSEGELDFFALYKETEEGLYSLFKGGWEYSSDSLETELEFDRNCLATKYIYVQVNRKTPKEETKDLFTPDCLVGVETNYGYITSVLSVSFGSKDCFNPSYVYTTESLSKEDLKDVRTLKYYISDESDETVSFTEYVNMFYDGWHNKYYECNENEIKP